MGLLWVQSLEDSRFLLRYHPPNRLSLSGGLIWMDCKQPVLHLRFQRLHDGRGDDIGTGLRSWREIRLATYAFPPLRPRDLRLTLFCKGMT